jgi:hypothetical protein
MNSAAAPRSTDDQEVTMISYTTADVAQRHPDNTGLEVCHVMNIVAGERDPITAEQYARVAERLDRIVADEAAAAHDAAIEDAIEDPRQYSAEYVATGRVAAPASVLRWVVLGRRLSTRRTVRVVVEAADHAGACTVARGRWGAGVLVDSATAQP